MRTSYSIKNTITQFITNIITIVFAFISQTLFIKILGIEYSGLNGLFNNILTILSLFELGISSSITYNLYKYVKKNDEETIKSIMRFYKKSYNKIALLILTIGLIITPFIKLIIKDITININVYTIYILFLLSTVATYILSYKRNIIIANQKNYIINMIHIIYIIILNTVQILILLITKNYYLYLIIKIILIMIENIVINFRANKIYPYLLEKNVKPIKKEVKDNITNRIKALMIHKTSLVVTKGTDNILISAFLGITTTGFFANYDYIIKAVKTLLGNIIGSITPSIGNLLIENNKEKNYNTFKKINFLNYWMTVFTSICILLITEPFIKIWLGEKYILSKLTLTMLVLNYFQTMMRTTFGSFKDGAGLWIEDKYIPLLQLSINLISSIILLKLIGLPGVFMGTIISSLVLWLYSYPKYVYIRLLGKNKKKYLKDFINHVALFLIIALISYTLNLFSDNILISILISISVPNIILFLVYKNTKEFDYYIKLIRKILIKKYRKT